MSNEGPDARSNGIERRGGSLRTVPGMVGPAIEDRIGVRALEGPIVAVDLGLQLPRHPARVAHEDPQSLHGLVTAEQPQQQVPISAQPDTVQDSNGLLGWSGGAKQVPNRFDLDRAAEVHLAGQLCKLFQAWKQLRNGNGRGFVDDDADRPRGEIVHHEHDRIGEIGVGQTCSSHEQNGGEGLGVVGEDRAHGEQQQDHAGADGGRAMGSPGIHD